MIINTTLKVAIVVTACQNGEAQFEAKFLKRHSDKIDEAMAAIAAAGGTAPAHDSSEITTGKVGDFAPAILTVITYS